MPLPAIGRTIAPPALAAAGRPAHRSPSPTGRPSGKQPAEGYDFETESMAEHAARTQQHAEALDAACCHAVLGSRNSFALLATKQIADRHPTPNRLRLH